MRPTESRDNEEWVRPLPGQLSLVVRGTLAVMALGMALVLGLAVTLNPYQPDGNPRTMGTHQQLGLPPCNFMVMTGYPCPSCGLTTSFSLMMHGDLVNSFRTNWVGTLMVITGFILIPWLIGGVIRGRLYWLRSLEMGAMGLLIAFAVLLVVRWASVLVMARFG